MDKTTKSGKTGNENTDETSRKFDIAGAQDLPDTPQDQEKMKPESAIIDIPDVKDIPGQEHIIPPPMGELADNTAASDDEEGVGIFEEETGETEFRMGTDADVTTEEKKD